MNNDAQMGTKDGNSEIQTPIPDAPPCGEEVVGYGHPKIKFPLLKVLITILNPEDAVKTLRIYEEMCTLLIFKMHGEGTADSDLMDLLGLGSSHKTITLCIAPEPRIYLLKERIVRDCKLRVRGNGIAFTLPFSGIAAPILKLASMGIQKEIKAEIKDAIESEVKKVKQNAEYELILTVVNPGFSEDLMDTARAAGAGGGTVVHARQLGNQMKRIGGISIQGEREIIATIVKHEDKKAVMQAISCKYGVTTEAQGLTIALPIDSVAGLDE